MLGHFSAKKAALLALFIVIIVSGGFWYGLGKGETGHSIIRFSTYNTPLAATPAVIINGLKIPVEVRRTPAEHEAGLSGRAELPAGTGMLFVFNRLAYHRFWMPDMNFPIDIVWIEGGRVVGIAPEASNDFDPRNPVYYRPPAPVEYVLEVNAGFMSKHSLGPGDEVTFDNI